MKKFLVKEIREAREIKKNQKIIDIKIEYRGNFFFLCSTGVNVVIEYTIHQHFTIEHWTQKNTHEFVYRPKHKKGF